MKSISCVAQIPLFKPLALTTSVIRTLVSIPLSFITETRMHSSRLRIVRCNDCLGAVGEGCVFRGVSAQGACVRGGGVGVYVSSGVSRGGVSRWVCVEGVYTSPLWTE